MRLIASVQAGGEHGQQLRLTFGDFDSDGERRTTLRVGNLSADGSTLHFGDGFPSWTNCAVAPSACVGPTRYPDVPTMRVEYGIGFPALRCDGLRFARVGMSDASPTTALRYLDLLLRLGDGAGTGAATFVREGDAEYLQGKWRPAGDRFLVEMVQMDPPTNGADLRVETVGATRWESVEGTWQARGGATIKHEDE